MPRIVAQQLTASRVKALLQKGEPGRFPDGNRLYLVVTGAGRGWWMLRYAAGRRSGSGKSVLSREMGLGPATWNGADGYSLGEARERADEQRRLLRDGVDPLADREAKAAAQAAAQGASKTFREVAEAYITEAASGWQNAKHAGQWRATLATYAYPLIGAKAISAIDLPDVKAVLAPIWTTKPETASRVRGRMEKVLAYAKVHGWRTGDNPALWRGNLQQAGLQPRAKVAPVEHHPALAWRHMPAFMAELRDQESVAARALEFLILTAARTGEVLGATWQEIDLAEATWTVPAARMKARKEHVVPLSPAAVVVLEQMAPMREEGGYVFPGQSRGQPLSGMALLKLLARMKRRDITPHGFRSTFRDWAGEATETPWEVVEKALAHQLKDKAERAYARGNLLDRRRPLMEAWAGFCAASAGQAAKAA